MYVCLCSAVTDHDIRDAVNSGVQSMEQLSERLGVSTNCGCCREAAEECLRSYRAEAPRASRAAAGAARMSESVERFLVHQAFPHPQRCS